MIFTGHTLPYAQWLYTVGYMPMSIMRHVVIIVIIV